MQSLTNQPSLYLSNSPIETKMGQPFSMLSLPYLTSVGCYPVAKSNNATQGFSVMQVLTLLLANLDYT